MLAFSAPSLAQDCTNPEADSGVVWFNVDFGVLQLCTPNNWVALHSQTCPDGSRCGAPPIGCDMIGQQCDDGSYYIGDSPEDGEKVYMTSSAHQKTSRSWDENPPCQRCGAGSATSITDGRANVEIFRAYGGGNATAGNLDGFGAAKYCDNLSGVHGHSDWYLPAGGAGTSELGLLRAMVLSVGPVDGIGNSTSYYWSSTEDEGLYANRQRFDTGSQGRYDKTTTNRIRCVRRAAAAPVVDTTDPVWTTAASTVATIDTGAALSTTVTATDDSGTVTYSKDSGAGWISVNSSTGELTGTAPGSATTDSITVIATDPSGNTATRTFDVEVQTAAADPCETGPEGTVCTSDGAIYAGELGGIRIYAAPQDETGTFEWGSGYNDDADSNTDGLTNTNNLVADGHSHPAAAICRNEHGADWYLPAIDELDVLYNNRSAIDANADGSFNTGTAYWSSTEYSNFTTGSWAQNFGGGQGGTSKTAAINVRCVRR